MTDLKINLINILQGMQAYHVSTNGVQHTIRCPFCGDSRNPSHSHLSIKIDVDNEMEPMLYRCLKCNVSGLVTETFLEEIDVFLDSESRKDLKIYTKKSMKFAHLTNTENEQYQVPLPLPDDRTMMKLNYLNRRLNTNISLNEAKDYKIILNLKEFILFNEINEIPNMELSMLQLLQDKYIGFLSTNNNRIVFRDVTGKQKYRYFKVILNEKNMNHDSFYSKPGKLPLMYTNDIHIHIAEGIFDILSIDKNLIRDDTNNYFYASCGFGGNQILKYVVRHGMTNNVIVHLYSDNDKYDWEHKRYLKKSNILEWVDRIYIHRNRCYGEKDYGVPSHRITDTRYLLK